MEGEEVSRVVGVVGGCVGTVVGGGHIWVVTGSICTPSRRALVKPGKTDSGKAWNMKGKQVVSVLTQRPSQNQDKSPLEYALNNLVMRKQLGCLAGASVTSLAQLEVMTISKIC